MRIKKRFEVRSDWSFCRAIELTPGLRAQLQRDTIRAQTAETRAREGPSNEQRKTKFEEQQRTQGTFQILKRARILVFSLLFILFIHSF